MAKREIPEINAGSMADIAFLLLIFFLVTTTMDKDTGLLRQLPMKIELEIQEPQDVAKRNLMKIQANAQGQLMIRTDMATTGDIRTKVHEFYTTNMKSEVDPTMPRYIDLSAEMIKDSIRDIDLYISKIADGEDVLLEFKEAERKEWEKRLKVAETLGRPFREIVRVAMVQIELQTRTEYELLITILNEAKAAINDIRDEIALEIYGVSYRTMIQKSTTDPKLEAEFADRIELIEILVPEKIVELKPADLAR